jgi:hypothetical protein
MFNCMRYFILILVLLFVVGCQSCVDVDNGVKMSLGDAVEFAELSECGDYEFDLDNAYCNEASGTWWFGLDLEQEGCNPHCVVDVNAGVSEINYMCP